MGFFPLPTSQLLSSGSVLKVENKKGVEIQLGDRPTNIVLSQRGQLIKFLLA
jgi:hypothetical protein